VARTTSVQALQPVDFYMVDKVRDEGLTETPVTTPCSSHSGKPAVRGSVAWIDENTVRFPAGVEGG